MERAGEGEKVKKVKKVKKGKAGELAKFIADTTCMCTRRTLRGRWLVNPSIPRATRYGKRARLWRSK